MKKKTIDIYYNMKSQDPNPVIFIRKIPKRLDTISSLLFYVPQIGSTIIIEGKKWNIADIHYDYDKNIIDVKSDVYVAEINRLKEQMQ